MSFFSSISETIAKIVWPWIKDNIWPIIQKVILEVASECMSWLVQKIKDLFTEHSGERAAEASNNAESAERKDDSTTDQNEATRYREQAAIWRQVAEQYRQDNEKLKKKISDYETESQKDLKDDIEEINPDLDVSNESGYQLNIGNSNHTLPKF